MIAGLILIPSLALGDQGEKILPRDFRQVQLLMSPAEVKEILKQARLKFREESGTDNLDVSYHLLTTKKAPEGFQQFSYHFSNGKLFTIIVEYDLLERPVDFTNYLSEVKRKYGEPLEVEETKTAPFDRLFNIKRTTYRWQDERTVLEVSYSPPGKEPILGRPAAGTINWIIRDRQLAEKEKKERAEKQAQKQTK